MDPVSGLIKPQRSLINVVLPHPEGPITPIISPSFTSNDRFWIIFLSP
jgi:hypothetical protein